MILKVFYIGEIAIVGLMILFMVLSTVKAKKFQKELDDYAKDQQDNDTNKNGSLDEFGC